MKAKIKLMIILQTGSAKKNEAGCLKENNQWDLKWEPQLEWVIVFLLNVKHVPRMC